MHPIAILWCVGESTRGAEYAKHTLIYWYAVVVTHTSPIEVHPIGVWCIDPLEDSPLLAVHYAVTR